MEGEMSYRPTPCKGRGIVREGDVRGIMSRENVLIPTIGYCDGVQPNLVAKTAAVWHKTKENAISLLDEIPNGRTCQTAGVAVHWCMCTYTQSVSNAELDAASSDWQLTAEWVVARINDLLHPAITAELCQPLALMHVVNAHYVIPTDLVRHILTSHLSSHTNCNMFLRIFIVMRIFYSQ